MTEKNKKPKDKKNVKKEDFFSGVFNTAVHSIITISEFGIIQTINPATEKMFGYNQNEVVGKNIKILMPDPYSSEHDHYLENYRKTNSRKIIGIGRDVEAKRKDGSVFPIYLSVSEAYLNNKRIFVGISRDITKQKEAEKKLRESEEKSRAMLESAVDAIITIDSRGIVQSMNRSAVELFEYKTEEVIGKNISMLMPQPYKDQHDGYLEKYHHTGTKKIIGIGREVEARKKSGTVIPIHLSVSEFKVDKTSYYTGIIRDISILKESQETVKKQNEFLNKQNWLIQNLAELGNVMRGDLSLAEMADTSLRFIAQAVNASIGIFYVSDGKVLTPLTGVSFPAKSMRSLELRIGDGLAGQAAKEQKPTFIQNIEHPYFKLETSFGNLVPKEIVAIPFVYNEETLGVIELGSLDGFKEMHRTFLNQIAEPVAVSVSTIQNKEKIFKLLQETQSQAEELQSQQEILRSINEELNNKTVELQSQQEELQAANEQLEEQKKAIAEHRDRLEIMNVTLKSARSKVEEKARDLEMSNKYKSEFLSTMSHELRTPLNSILILSKILSNNEDHNLTEEQVESAKTIHSSGSDLLNMINDILDLTKIEAGRLDLFTEKIRLRDVIDRMKRSFEPMMMSKGLTLSFKVMQGLPDSIVSDKMRLEQILKNFLSNALKFTEKGGVEVVFERLKNEHVLKRDDLIRERSLMISVRDTGIGIPKDKQGIIFEAFRQVDSTISRKYGGTGLGLSIATVLANKLGGEIFLESHENEGSCFSLIIPEVFKGDTEEDLLLKSEIQTKTVSPEVKHDEIHKDDSELDDDRDHITKADRLILIIEDDKNFARVLMQGCHKKDLKCLYSQTAEEGLRLASQYLPHAIILDVRLPDASGMLVVDQLKSNSITRNIPVHIISVDDVGRNVMKLGAMSFFQKPVDVKILEDIILKIKDSVETRKKRILLIEDNENQKKSIKNLIEADDVDVMDSSTVLEAHEKLRQHAFDCIILDLNLQGASGVEFLSGIHKQNPKVKPPVIIYTGRDLTRAETNSLENMAESVIIKGAKSPERLVDEVALFLHRVEATMPEDKKKIIEKIRHREEVFNHKKLLICDDDMRNVFALRQLLAKKGAEIIVAKTGVEALSQLQKHPDIDAVLMDIMMPEMDGYLATAEIRKQKQFLRLPIIALTAKAMKGDREKCLNSGASDYLTKPIQEDRLLSLLRVWLTR